MLGQARRAAEGVVGGRRPEPSVSPLEELEEAGQKPAEGVLGGINADARLKESYDLLISEGWELRRRNIFIGNSDVDEDRKLLFIDDDPEPVATTTEWATDVVRKAYQGDDDLRRRAIRDKAIAIFSDAGLTDLEKMARTYEWAVWFWRFPFDTGDPVELLDDMMLVLTDLEPSGLSLNDGTYHIFRAGRAARANSTGFKYAFRDDSNQVRHATGSIQGSLTFGPAGFGFLQLREDSDSADWRLNSRCFDIAEGLKFRLPNFLARDIGAVLRRELGDPAQTGPWTGPPDGDPNAPMP